MLNIEEEEFNPSWNSINDWLLIEETKRNNSEYPYGYGELLRRSKIPGFYTLYFPTNKNVYFGSSSNLYLCRFKHITNLKKGKHNNKKLQHAFDDMGLNALMFFYRETNSHREATEIQQKFIDDYLENPHLLNTDFIQKEKSFYSYHNDSFNKSNFYMPLTLTNNTEPSIEESNKLHNKGIVFYTDGSCRPTNPGNIGWGIHGYHYENESPKKGSGNQTHVLTASGYVPKNEKPPEGFTEVTPLKFFDFFGSNLDQNSNNVAEMDAARNAFLYAVTYDIDNLTIFTDSEYVRRGITEWSPTWIKRNWIKSDGGEVPNAFYWKKLLEALDALKDKGIKVEINWVKAHIGIYGNTIADKLATVAAMYSMKRIIRNEYNISAPEGYFKLASEKHPFISNKRMYFNTISSSQIEGEYYLGDHGVDDNMLGKKNSDCAYSVIQLSTPDPILEKLRKYQTSIAYDIDSIITSRLDKLFSPEIYNDIINYDEGAFVRVNSYSLDINCLDTKPLTKELRPPRLAMRAIEAISMLKDKLTLFKSKETDKDNTFVSPDHFKATNITDVFYDSEVKIKKNIEETTYKLKAKYNVGFSALQVKSSFVKDDKTIDLNLTLTLGIDLPDRNGLKKLEEMKPEIYLVTWCEGLSSVRYAVIGKAEGSYGIWAGVYSNLIFI